MTTTLKQRRVKVGEAGYKTTALTDKHILDIIDFIAKETGKTREDITKIVENRIHYELDYFKKSPILCETVSNNIVESVLFDMIGANLMNQSKYKDGFDSNQVGTPKKCPIFSETIFFKLVRIIKATHNEMFPLRGFIDRKVLRNIDFIFVPTSDKKYMQFNKHKTAAALSGGGFVFNIEFCQMLMNFAHLVGLKGAGNKYVSNGGQIPDEYAYIEFVILHEFMHYTNDDFYYGSILAKNSKLDHKIVNWVGDFRSNHVLVKSGYPQLPVGLFNDSINYDRQSSYVEMFNLIKSEMEKLPKDERDEVSDKIDEFSSDEHTQESPADGGDADAGKIDDAFKKTKDNVEDGSNSDDSVGSARDDKSDSNSKTGSSSGNTVNPLAQNIDYTKVTPRYNWKELIKQFIYSKARTFEETYAKPNKRGVTTADMVRQVGAGAIKPSDKISDLKDLHLMFVVDSSGSMSSEIEAAYSNIANLLNVPTLKKTKSIVCRFSNDFEMYKGNFSSDKAAKITDVNEEPTSMSISYRTIFNSHFGGSTNFSVGLSEQIHDAINKKYNVMIFTDSDIFTDKSNLDNLSNLMKSCPKNVFLIFNDRETYVRWRSTPGTVSIQNISHM